MAPTSDRRRHTLERLSEALRIVLLREHLRRTLGIALIVGTILTLINQADVIVGGEGSVVTAVKVALNYCVPFIVSNLGLLAGKRAEAEREAVGLAGGPGEPPARPPSP